MKKYILFLLLLSQIQVHSQELAQVTFSQGTTLSYISFVTNGDVLIRVSPDGNIMEWGTELQSLRNSDYYAPKLQPYMGRIEYYGQEADSVFRGKLKAIGTAMITYYGSYETPEKIGKLRSIGTMIFDYYSQYDDKELRGKLKLAGTLPLEFYNSFDEQSLRGKLKAVGNSPITYYSSFEDRMVKGKIKSIGSIGYAWYTSLDLGRGGALKTGTYRQSIGGVTYILW